MRIPDSIIYGNRFENIGYIQDMRTQNMKIQEIQDMRIQKVQNMKIQET